MREGAADGSSRSGVGVEAVTPGSPADRAGIVAGDRILSVSGRPVEDLLDLHFLTSRSRFTLAWRDASGAARKKEFRLRGETPGIFPEPIRVRRCRNRCIFCFVHQLPKGLRRTLYVKDEDVRLSFLHGQYVTFSDLSEEEAAKIVRYRLSPLYVSIHTTDPAAAPAYAGEPAGGRRDARDAAADPRRDHPSRPDRRLPRRQRRRGARPNRPGALRPSSRASHGGGGPGGAHLPSGRTAAAAPGHARPGAGDARPAPRAGQGDSGKGRTGSRLRSPPTNIS